MTQKILIITLCFCISMNCFAQQKKTTHLSNRLMDIGIVYPLTSNGRNAELYNNSFSLQAIAGLSGGISGCAVAGIVNIVREDVNGAAISGIGNIINGSARGWQVAGIFNSVNQEVKGVQIAGILNTAGKVKGMQMSGLINKATKVNGVQLSGLLNIADSSDYPIGFVNLISNGEKSLVISTDESLNTLISFESGGRVLYGNLGLGYNLSSSLHLFLLQAGIGAHLLNIKNHFRINAEVAQLVQTDFTNGHLFRYSLRILPDIKITPHLRIFAGPSANLVLDYSSKKMSGNMGHYFWDTAGPNGHFIGSYVGLTGGIKYIF